MAVAFNRMYGARTGSPTGPGVQPLMRAFLHSVRSFLLRLDPLRWIASGVTIGFFVGVFCRYLQTPWWVPPLASALSFGVLYFWVQRPGVSRLRNWYDRVHVRSRGKLLNIDWIAERAGALPTQTPISASKDRIVGFHEAVLVLQRGGRIAPRGHTSHITAWEVRGSGLMCLIGSRWSSSMKTVEEWQKNYQRVFSRSDFTVVRERSESARKI